MSDKSEAIYIPQLSIFTRYGLCDRMGDGYCEPPNRREWSFEQLYNDWKSHGFFKSIQDSGFLIVSYNDSPFIDFEPDAECANRHQVLALSCFMDSCYADNNEKVTITAPHEQDGNDFLAVFEKQANGDIIYTTDIGKVVRFRFDKTRQSQF